MLLRLHRWPVFIDGLEIAAVERDVVLVFAGQHGVGLRSAATRIVRAGKRHRLARLRCSRRRSAVGVRRSCIDLHFFRRQAFGEAHAFLERLGDFFVIQRVAGRIDQTAAVSDGDAAPGVQQVDQIAARGLRARQPRARREWPGRERETRRRFRLLRGVQLARTVASPRSATSVS